jgi:hypothetical protein
MDANHEKRMARMDARQAEMDAWQVRMDANHEMRMTRRDAWLTEIKNDRKETMACLEEAEARLEVEDKTVSVDTTPVVAHEQEVPLEANLERTEPNPRETEAVMERQETSNKEVAINFPRACQNERTKCQEATKANSEKITQQPSRNR